MTSKCIKRLREMKIDPQMDMVERTNCSDLRQAQDSRNASKLLSTSKHKDQSIVWKHKRVGKLCKFGLKNHPCYGTSRLELMPHHQSISNQRDFLANIERHSIYQIVS